MKPGRSAKSVKFIVFSMVIFAALVSVLGAGAQEEKYAYTYQGKRDPFVSLISPAGYLLNLEPQDNSTLQLEGVMFDPKGDSMAIINGELLRVGDTLGDVLVTGIEVDKVTVIKNNEKIVVELRREE
jgi:hypothetical protein